MNAAAELTAIVSSFFVGMATSIGPLRIEDYGIRVMVITIVVCTLWIAAMFLTPPESEATLNEFYRRVRPGGSGWHRQQQQTGLRPAQDLLKDVKRSIAANFLLFGILLSTGGFLLLQPRMGWLSLIVAVGGWMWLRQLNKRTYPPMPRPGSDEG